MADIDYPLPKKTQEAWRTPTLLNSWVEFDSSRAPRYMKDTLGFVHMKGLVKNGTSATAVIFALPVGYRPIGIAYFVVLSNNIPTPITVASSNGAVALSVGGSTTYVALDGITFKAEA